jgi:probable F420-dependent oxidoreductase
VAQFGALLPSLGEAPSAEALVDFACRMEELGYGYLMAGDHIALPVQPESRYHGGSTGVAAFTSQHEIYESLTLISHLSGITTKVRLGIAVQILPYRNPVLNAKQLTTLDVLSGGRVVLGVGTGWCVEEFQALGATYEDREAVADEQIAIFKQACTGEELDFDGEHFKVHGTRILPRPRQLPHPPIWAGGISKRARRRAALLADGWYPIRLHPDEIAVRLKEILAMREEAGLPTEDYGVTMGLPVHWGSDPLPPNFKVALQGSASEMIEKVGELSEAGVKVFVLRSSSDEYDRAREDMERFGEEVVGRV